MTALTFNSELSDLETAVMEMTSPRKNRIQKCRQTFPSPKG